jgi:hypothetical protein
LKVHLTGLLVASRDGDTEIDQDEVTRQAHYAVARVDVSVGQPFDTSTESIGYIVVTLAVASVVTVQKGDR